MIPSAKEFMRAFSDGNNQKKRVDRGLGEAVLTPLTEGVTPPAQMRFNRFSRLSTPTETIPPEVHQYYSDKLYH